MSTKWTSPRSRQTRAMMNDDRGANPKLTLLPLPDQRMCRVLPDYP
jgi:hypothetical protein